MTKRIFTKILSVLLVLSFLVSGVACSSAPHDHSFGEYTVIKQSTCIEKGVKKRTCSCGEYETVDIPLADHEYGAWIDKTSATCDTDGVKGHKDCIVCHKHFDNENNEIVDLLIEKGHNYGTWIDEVSATYDNFGVKGHYHCEVCRKNFDANYNEITNLQIDKLVDDFNQSSGAFPTVKTEHGKTYVEFGYYPQTVLSEQQTIDKLDNAIKNGLTVNAYGYYQMDGKYYVKKTATPYLAGDSYDKFENGSVIEDGKDYYFNVEPILWRVVKVSNNAYTLIADKLIEVSIFDASQYEEEVDGTTINPNDYSVSDIRTWLNGEFLNGAFRTFEKEFISLTQIDNGSYDSCEDKIFLPSLDDMYNTEYGFATDADRMAFATDYVRASGVTMTPMMPEGTQTGYAKYWLRTSGEINIQNALVINVYGQDVENQTRKLTEVAVRPMLIIENSGN